MKLMDRHFSTLLLGPALEQEKQTPFQSCLPTNDVRYSLRHVEESWIHLLKSGKNLSSRYGYRVEGDNLLSSNRNTAADQLDNL